MIEKCIKKLNILFVSTNVLCLLTAENTVIVAVAASGDTKGNDEQRTMQELLVV